MKEKKAKKQGVEDKKQETEKWIGRRAWEEDGKKSEMSRYGFYISISTVLYEQKLFHDRLTLSMSTRKCWLERDLNSHLRDTGSPLYLLNYRVHRDWRWVFIQFKCTRYSRDNLMLNHERMCSVSILFQRISREYLVHLNWIKTHLQSLWTR